MTKNGEEVLTCSFSWESQENSVTLHTSTGLNVNLEVSKWLRNSVMEASSLHSHSYDVMTEIEDMVSDLKKFELSPKELIKVQKMYNCLKDMLEEHKQQNNDFEEISDHLKKIDDDTFKENGAKVVHLVETGIRCVRLSPLIYLFPFHDSIQINEITKFHIH